MSPKKNAPTHPKVVAATAGAGAGAVVSEFLIWGIDEIFYNGAAAPDVPTPLVGFIGLVVTGGLALAAGWLKRAE